jgi:tetratricopeptide (TPR) repeat protein
MRANDQALNRRLTNIEKALSLPGHSTGELYPTVSDITTALTEAPQDKYSDELKSVDPGNRSVDLEESPVDSEDSIIEVTLKVEESPIEHPEAEKAVSTAEVFGPSVAERYSSLLIVSDAAQGNRLFAKAVRLRAEMLLLQSPESPKLLAAFSEIADKKIFESWLAPMFAELPAICDCPSPRDFLESGMDSPEEIIAAISGLIFMMSDKFSEAQETLNMIPDSRYLQALNICLWAMAKFQSPQMEKIRRSSLKSATGLLRESILANKKSEKRSTIVLSSHPGAQFVDSYFLRGLIFEQLGEYKHSISNFRECKHMLRTGDRLYPNVRPWANLAQGKGLYEMGMPSEAFIRWKRTLMHEYRSPWFSFLELGITKPRELLALHILQCCEEALSRYVDSSLLWCVKGKLVGCFGNHEEMIDCAVRAFKKDEDYLPAHFLKMEALAFSENFSDALRSLKICALKQPHEPMFMLRGAEILCRLGEDGEALQELKKAIGHGLDLSELGASIKTGRLGALEQFDEFAEILSHLESA